MAYIELNKAQIRSLVDQYIDEMTTEEFEKFLLGKIRYFSSWENAGLTRIIQKATSLQKSSNYEE